MGDEAKSRGGYLPLSESDRFFYKYKSLRASQGSDGSHKEKFVENTHVSGPGVQGFKGGFGGKAWCGKEEDYPGKRGGGINVFFLPGVKAQKGIDSPAGCKVLTYKTRKEEGFSLRKDFLEAITEGMDMVILCNPNNPTGNVIERNLLKDILIKCQETGTYLIVDECFNEFIPGAKKHTLLPFVEEYDKLIILKAFTKLYGMPGIRLGYALTGDEELPGKVKKVTQPWNISVLAQEAGLAALKEDDFVKESLSNIEKEKRRMIIALSKAGYVIYESAANFIFFEGDYHLAETCLEQGIFIRDCSSFAGLSKGYYRVCIRTRWENDKLLKVLIEAKHETETKKKTGEK